METLRRIGSAEKALGEHNDAIAHYEEALKLAIERQDEPAISELLGDLSEVRLEIGDVEGAIADLKRALKFDVKHEDTLGEALVHRRLGAALQHKGKYEEAEESYQESWSLLEALDDDGEKAVLLTHRGSLFEEEGKYAKALDAYREARRLNEADGSNPIGVAICLRHEASALREQGDYDDARIAVDKASELLRSTEDAPERVEVELVRANIMLDERRLAAALAVFESALKTARALDLPLLRARLLRGSGDAYALVGGLDNAEINYREAIEIFRARNHRPYLADLYSDLGGVRIKLGRISDAIRWLEQAQELESEQKNALGKAVANRRLGFAFQRRGDFDEAEKAYVKSDRGLDGAEDSIERALLLLRWGSLREQQGQLAKALRLYDTGLSTFQSLPDRNVAGVAACLRHRASVLWQQQDHDAALEDLREAGLLLEHSEERAEAIATHALLAPSTSMSGSRTRICG